MAATDRDAHSPTASRPTTSGFGKCTAAVKTLLPDEVKDDFTRWWREAGYPSESDATRELIMVATYGAKHLSDIHANRIAALARNMAGIGTESKL